MTSSFGDYHLRQQRERRLGIDRRVRERRRVELVVAVERRAEADRRAVERRRGATMLTFPGAPDPEALRTVLRRAIERTERRWSDEVGGAEAAAEGSELLQALERALLLHTRPDERLRSATGRRLVHLVRAELVGLAASAPPPLRAGGLWHLMEAIEEVLQGIECPWQEPVAMDLTGLGGLEQVVEMAHDLRSPLTSVLFLAEVLARGQSGPVNELQRRQLGLIYSAAIGLNQLAGNVIELARGGNRLAGGDPAPFSITDLMMSVCDIVQPIAEEKGIEMHVTPPAVDHRLGHAVALSRVLLNLTTNALKFIREGYVDVRARETAVDRVEFSVRDTGPGINQNSVQSLYSAFRPDPAGHGYVLSGTGLGLALCHKLVSIMGGTLQVETREKWGTRFYFDLTLKPVALI